MIMFSVCSLFGLIMFYFMQIPDSFNCFSDDFPNRLMVGINLVKSSDHMPTSKNFFSFVNNDQFTAFLFNMIPVKDVGVTMLGEKVSVNPCGTPFGLKFLTDGVLVVNLSRVKIEGGEKFPAKDAGLKKGDVLISVNGKKIKSNFQLKNVVVSNGSNPLKLKVRRGSNEFETELRPAFSVEHGCWQSGIWLRDSSAGIGTLTFVTKSGLFGGLGHAVFDVDTGNSMPFGKGEIVAVSIKDIKHADFSKPGELCGEFVNNTPIGEIKINTESGLYGRLNGSTSSIKSSIEPLQIGLKHEVKVGKAYIYSTVEGETSKRYEIEIESINLKKDFKNIIFKVVDRELLEKTGGIVQGMSGSPIVQNNRLVGAITHVFLNDPSRGYGVFAETMLLTLREALKSEV